MTHFSASEPKLRAGFMESMRSAGTTTDRRSNKTRACPEGQPAPLFFSSPMKCFYRVRHREIEKPTKSITLRPPMAFWLSVLAICLLLK